MDADKKALLDYLHKCLMCNKPAYEYETDKYVCSSKECEFEWEVMNHAE